LTLKVFSIRPQNKMLAIDFDSRENAGNN